MNNRILETIQHTVEKWSGGDTGKILPMPNSGSERKYFRVFTNGSTIIAVYNPCKKENQAFIDYTKQFTQLRLNVPRLLLDNTKYNCYLIEDLGNMQLLAWLNERREETGSFPKDAIQIYEQVLNELIRFQVIGGANLDYKYAFPIKSFNIQAIKWDLNYFKYYFLKPSGIQFDELMLEENFNTFASYLDSAENHYFMFRDFQARNIMIGKNDEPNFIDYQGGRKGPLQYDLASLLFQAKAEIPEDIQMQLLLYYLKKIKVLVPIAEDEFIEFFYAYALIRNLQTLGAYGYRGLIQQKPHFIQSIPKAINNLSQLANRLKIKHKLDELMRSIEQILEIDYNQISENGQFNSNY